MGWQEGGNENKEGKKKKDENHSLEQLGAVEVI